MIAESDIYRSAQVLIREHGDLALEVAESRANKFWDAGDDEGAAVWMRIARAIRDLQKVRPEASNRTH